MQTKQFKPEHLEVFVGSNHCFHDTTRVSLQTSYDGDYETVAEIWPTDGGIEQDEKIGRHMAAAVNACEGIPTVALENGIVAKIITELGSPPSADPDSPTAIEIICAAFIAEGKLNPPT